MGLTDAFLTYKIVKMLATPFTKWEAFELGLIDKDGNTLKKAETREEKDAFPKWLIIIKNIKKVLGKLPLGTTKLGSFAAALWLIKEETGIHDIECLESAFKEHVKNKNILIEKENDDILNILDKGRYLYETENMPVITKEDLKPVGHVFGVPVFEVTDKVTDKKIFATAAELRKF